MLSSGSATPKLCVDDVLAFDDAELVEYMKRNHRLDGGFDLEFEGWENLPKDQRERLAEKLRIGAQKVNDDVQSRPVDADQLAARLHGVADDRDELSQALSDRDAERKSCETMAYNDLVNDGGRPVYPISLLDEISKDPEEYYDMLRPWLDYLNEWYEVFQTQLHRWKIFRRWQQDNRESYDEEKEFAAYVEEQKRQDTEGTVFRPTASQYLEQLRASFRRKQRYQGLDDGDEEFAAYVEKMKQKEFQAGCKWPGMTEDEYMQMLRNKFKKKQTKEGIDDGDEGFAAFVEKEKQKDMEAGRRWPGMTEDEYLQMLRDEFDREQSHHYWLEFYWLREDHGRGGFPEYVEEAKRRLVRHGFTQTFQLEEDPTRQDKLTTWIEYLNYEYSWLDHHTRTLTRLQPEYDKAWQKLVDSGVLRPGETDKNLRTMESAVRRQSEEDAARKVVEHAKTAAAAVLEKAMNEPSRSNIPKPARIRMMKEAGFRLDAARASLRTVMRRGDLISEFVQGASDYKAAEENISLQNTRLQWIRGQVPLIEVELKEPKVAEDSFCARRGTKRRLEDDQENEVTKDRSPKKQKQSHQASSHPEVHSSSAQARQTCKRSRHGDAVDRSSLKRLRNDRQDWKFHQHGVDATSNGNSQLTVVSASRRQSADVFQPLATAKQLRRSPRIAALQDRSRKAVAPPHVATSLPPRSRRKIAQVST